jgi:Methyltransferase FkbM domain
VGTVPGGGYEIEVTDFFALLAGRRIDILKIDIGGSEYELLEDPRFGDLNIRAIIMAWHERKDRPEGHAWCCERLRKLGFQLYPVFEQKTHGMMWAYQKRVPASVAAAHSMATGVLGSNPRNF